LTGIDFASDGKAIDPTLQTKAKINQQRSSNITHIKEGNNSEPLHHMGFLSISAFVSIRQDMISPVSSRLLYNH
jgi:hypothetical protein